MLISYLNVCFDRCGRVCKSWSQIIQQDKVASSRRRSHLSQVEAALEVGGRLWREAL